MKKRLAIWLHGGIGNGNFSQGYPMLDKLVERLSTEFDIIVYSHTPPNEGYHTERFPLKYPPRSMKSAKRRWIYLMWIFYNDHRTVKFNSLLAFWGFPTGFFASVIKKIFRINIVISVLGADSASIPSIDYGIFHRRFPRTISTWAYMNATVLLAISEFQKNKLSGFGIDRDIKVVPWGADAEMYPFSEKPLRETLNVIHVGHINPVKDQPTLLRAFAIIAKHMPAQLKIFGLDCLDGAMQKLCEELGIRDKVEFMGVQPYTAMPEYYKAADIMLHTSLSEGQCMALTEAAACGVLIAGTKVGLLYDLGDEYGITVNPGEHEVLANKVLALRATPIEWNRRIQNAKTWSQNHNFDWTVNEITKLIKNL